MLNASAKAQANMHLAAGSSENGEGAGINSNNFSTNNGKKSDTKKGSQPQSAPRDKTTGKHPKPALKAGVSYINKNKEKGQHHGKKAHFDPEAYES